MIKMEKLKKQVRHYQLHSGKTYMQYEQDKYSKYQNYLYKRALYGLSSIEKDELEKMCESKKHRIRTVHRRAQGVLNIAKQKVTIAHTNDIFQYFFPNSKLIKQLAELTDTDENFRNSLTFKDLLLTKDDIISIFIENGILPKNFLSLKEEPVRLPSLKNENKTQRV